MKVYFQHHHHDFPKQTGDIRLAWYQEGRVCVMRNYRQTHQLQTQNLQISRINAVCKALWENILPAFKKDLSQYASAYKKTYPGLRKRGISSYSVMLMLVHALIRRFQLSDRDTEHLVNIIESMLQGRSLYDLIQMRLLKSVPGAYQLNYKTGYNFTQIIPVLLSNCRLMFAFSEHFEINYEKYPVYFARAP